MTSTQMRGRRRRVIKRSWSLQHVRVTLRAIWHVRFHASSPSKRDLPVCNAQINLAFQLAAEWDQSPVPRCSSLPGQMLLRGASICIFARRTAEILICETVTPVLKDSQIMTARSQNWSAGFLLRFARRHAKQIARLRALFRTSVSGAAPIEVFNSALLGYSSGRPLLEGSAWFRWRSIKRIVHPLSCRQISIANSALALETNDTPPGLSLSSPANPTGAA